MPALVGTESSERVPGGAAGLREVLRREAEVRAVDRELHEESDGIKRLKWGRRCETRGASSVSGYDAISDHLVSNSSYYRRETICGVQCKREHRYEYRRGHKYECKRQDQHEYECKRHRG